jgi:thiamine biosynthesis lipoprotein
MGCEVVVEGAGPTAFAAIVGLFEERERIFSRFRAGSELNRVNAARGEVVPVSRPFARALRAALSAARATGGIVDPTLGAALEAAGYDRDFAELGVDPRPPGRAAPGRWRSVELGEGVVRRPAGTRLDLNGVVKGLTVDDAALLLDRPGYVSAGGDLAVRGTPAVVGLPDGPPVTLERGGIATSGSGVRRWRRGGRERHHLIDAATGRPSTSRWAYVTAAGATCVQADVAAKAGLLLGEDGPEWLDERGVAARFVSPDLIIENGSWTRSVRREPAWA